MKIFFLSLFHLYRHLFYIKTIQSNLQVIIIFMHNQQISKYSGHQVNYKKKKKN